MALIFEADFSSLISGETPLPLFDFSALLSMSERQVTEISLQSDSESWMNYALLCFTSIGTPLAVFLTLGGSSSVIVLSLSDTYPFSIPNASLFSFSRSSYFILSSAFTLNSSSSSSLLIIFFSIWSYWLFFLPF